MRQDLDHLPEGKRRELAYVVDLIQAGFAEALSRRTQERFRNGAILKIVLFGSYARGGWVEDPIGRYYSDYDLLIVVNHEDLTDPSEFWGPTEQRLLEALSAAQHLRTPVSLIVHSLEDVNAQLRRGRPFFIDIVRDGIALIEASDASFVEADPLQPKDALAEAQAHFDEWFSSAEAFARGASFYESENRPKEAVFSLHQAAERFYHGLLLVRASYSPKTHSLNRLRSICEELDGRLTAIWPSTGKFERRTYELLRAAYVKARYSPQFSINGDELIWLKARVTLLRNAVEEACSERLSELRRAALG